jgi:hypothetical protein
MSTLQLRPALGRPVRRRDLAVPATVLLASAAGGMIVALIQPRDHVARVETPVAVPIPVPAVVRAPAPAVAPFDLAPVIHEGGLRVVLSTEVEPRWIGGGDITVRDEDGVRVVTRPLSRAGGEQFGRFLGSRVRLLAGDHSCLAEVTSLSLVGRFAPDGFGEDPDQAVSGGAAWSAASGSYLVAGALEVADRECGAALWAAAPAYPAPLPATVAEANHELTRRAADMLRAEPGFADATAGAHAEFEVDVVSAAGGETVLVASALVEGCVDGEPVLTALYTLQDDGSLHPVGAPMTVGSIEAAADIDGDGHVEFLVRGDTLDLAILRRRAGRYEREAQAMVPIFGCRC